MACCMVYWGNNIVKYQSVFFKFGAVVNISDLIGKRISTENDEESMLFQEEDFIVAQSFA
jgi:hypothetical protein